MTQYGWNSCPDTVRDQVEGLVRAAREFLGENLAGIYLHGSLALGCFNPERSDVDILVVTERGLTPNEKSRIAELLLRHSGRPSPIEISFLQKGHIHPWKYPTPFDFHYSEDWREKYEGILSSSDLNRWEYFPETDEDLAAHIIVTQKCGITLFGRAFGEVLPSVPKEHYLASIVADFHWGKERIGQYPRNFILNACRVYGYLSEGEVWSKDEAGEWALQILPIKYRGLVEQALKNYRGNAEEEGFDAATLERFTAEIEERIKTLLAARNMAE